MSQPIIKVKDRRLSVAVFEGVRKDNKQPYKQVVVQTGIPPKSPGGKWDNRSISIFSDQLDSLITLLSSVKQQLGKV